MLASDVNIVAKPYPLPIRSVSSLNDPQNSEMKICEKYEVDIKVENHHKYHRLHSDVISLLTSQYYSR
jgi:hypothetical protein